MSKGEANSMFLPNWAQKSRQEAKRSNANNEIKLPTAPTRK